MNYKKLSIALGFVVAFLAGCVLHQSFVVPPARAETNPPRWEYACVEATEQITMASNRFGAEGWEMAAAAGPGWGIWCFKRPRA